MSLVDIALREVGTREEGGNNCGERIREYQSATWLKTGPWPWCAAFTAWVLKRWLETPEGIAYLAGRSGEVFRCRDASAFGWEKWGKARGLEVLPDTGRPLPGDFCVFDFSHIGIVTGISESGSIQTVEGNTNGKDERDSTSGDGVWLKARSPSLVKCYIRL